MRIETLILSTLVATAFVFSSCEAKFDWSWNKDKEGRTAQTSRKTVSVERALGAFSSVKLDGLGQLIFDPSIPAGVVRITGDEGILPQVLTTVESDQLLLTEEGLQGPDHWDLEFRVAAPSNLSRITLSGLGTISSAQLISLKSELALNLEGLGKIELELEAPAVNLHQQGSGEMVVRGKATRVSVQADGLGRVDVSELITTDAEVTSNGLGEVSVYSSDKLKVRANGMGAVHFRGNPQHTDVQTQGLTQVSAQE